MSEETNKPSLQDQIDDLEKAVGELRLKPKPLPEAESRIIARMNRNTSWAIHFSTVRMTIATFFITVCVTLMGLKWGDAELSVVIAAAVIWVCGFTLFFLFTKRRLHLQ